MAEYDVEYMDIQLCVKGVYVEAQPRIMYDNNLSGQPGSPHEFEIYNIMCGEQDIVGIVDESVLENIQEYILDAYYG